MMQRPKKPEAGFTLIEIAIVVIIIGIMLIPLVQLYESYVSGQKLAATKDHLEAMKDTVSSYRDTFSPPHYPCPSDRGLASNAPGYRKQYNGGDCSLAALETLLQVSTKVTATTPACTANFGFCVVLGPPGTDHDGDGKADYILIGGVPIVDIGPVVEDAGGAFYPVSDVLDGWGNNFTYAVSLDLVVPGPYNVNLNGGIAVTDENDQPTAGINNDGHYVILSHGPDGKGAFTKEGAVVAPCGADLDSENCDNDDYIFRSALALYQGTTKFDDLVYADKKLDSGIWENIYFGSANTGSIHNLNTANVGVNTSTPLVKLDVNGKVRTDFTTSAAKICKDNATTDGADCFDVRAITSTDDTIRIRCPNADAPAKTVMIGISNGKAVCALPPAPTSGTAPLHPCAPGKHMIGINIVTGEAQCEL